MIRRLPCCHVVLFVKYFVITLNGMFEPRTNFDVITPTSWYVITALTFIMGLAICDPIRSSSPGSLPQGGGSDLWDFVEVSREHSNIVTTAPPLLPRSFARSLVSFKAFVCSQQQPSLGKMFAPSTPLLSLWAFRLDAALQKAAAASDDTKGLGVQTREGATTKTLSMMT